MSLLTVEERLAVWAAQGPSCRITDAEIAFIAAMRTARLNRVGYGWMRQVIGWEWEHETPGYGLTDETIFALGRQEGRDDAVAATVAPPSPASVAAIACAEMLASMLDPRPLDRHGKPQRPYIAGLTLDDMRDELERVADDYVKAKGGT